MHPAPETASPALQPAMPTQAPEKTPFPEKTPVPEKTHAPEQTPSPERTLAPDLARGMMLLFIALANISWYLYDSRPGLVGLHPEPTNLADKIWQAILITVIDARSFPMFTFLFAYGMVQFYTSRRRRGLPDQPVRRMLTRRNLWMIAFGAVHAALLFAGDVLGAYGFIGWLLGLALFRRRDKLLWIWMVVLLTLISLLPALIGLSYGLSRGFGADRYVAPAPDPTSIIVQTNGDVSYLSSMLWRVVMWLPGVPLSVIVGLAPVMIAGWLAARHRLLEDARAHQRLLATIAVVTIIPGWALGALQAMVQLQVIRPHYRETFSLASDAAGLATGIGYACLFGLIGARWQQRPPVVVTSIAAVGQRSLSFYLLQSLIMAPVLSGWGLGLGGRFGTWQVMTMAVGIWLVSVVIAEVLRRRGARGPAEKLLRWLTYGKTLGAAPGSGTFAIPLGGDLMPWDPRFAEWERHQQMLAWQRMYPPPGPWAGGGAPMPTPGQMGHPPAPAQAQQAGPQPWPEPGASHPPVQGQPGQPGQPSTSHTPWRQTALATGHGPAQVGGHRGHEPVDEESFWARPGHPDHTGLGEDINADGSSQHRR